MNRVQRYLNLFNSIEDFFMANNTKFACIINKFPTSYELKNLIFETLGLCNPGPVNKVIDLWIKEGPKNIKWYENWE
jgi:hypothetical protein